MSMSGASSPAASTVHSNNEQEPSPSMAMARQSQPIQPPTPMPMQPLYATQPLTQQRNTPIIADSQIHLTLPESQQTLTLQTQPDTQNEHQYPPLLAGVPQYKLFSHGTDQAFITQPMTQQCNVTETTPSPCFEGRSSVLHPDHHCTDCASDEAMEQKCVDDDADATDDDATAVGGTLSKSKQPVAMQHVATKDEKNNDNETSLALDRIHAESIGHHPATTGPEALAPPPPPLPTPLQSLTNTGYTTSTEQLRRTSQSTPKINTVVNPYAKKRSLDQSSRSSRSSGSIGGATNSISYTHNLHNNDAADAGNAMLRKQVYNPYSKTKTNALQRQSMASSVGAGNVASSHLPSITNLPGNNDTKTTVGNTARDYVAPSRTIMNHASAPMPVPPSRRSGISISLPIYERLPSRNVSYQPAEILTVGELYRYLYRPRRVDEVNLSGNKMHQPSRSEVAAGALGEAELDHISSREMTSIRITGTLLCIATSNPNEERDAAEDSVYGRGVYLLIGDPLETSRLSEMEVIPSRQSDTKNAKLNDVGAVSDTHKGGSESILASDNASVVESSTVLSNTPSTTPVIALNSVTDQTRGAQRTNEKDDSFNTVKRKELNRSILNTQKKKLVYNGGGKRLSFGGRGLGGNASGGGVRSGSLLLGGKKFVTPKRIESTPHVTQRLGFVSAMKRWSSTSVKTAADGNTTNPKPEYVIQQHPSPIVPVWLGSFYNDDGLDGSVVGDLVMIMGEIVTDYCVNCQMINSAHHGDESKIYGGYEGMPMSNTVNHTIDAGEEPRYPCHMRTFSTQIRGVRDASSCIARMAMKISGERQPSLPTMTPKRTSFCFDCPRFVRARFVKNANGTDVLLQKEALRARRAYMQERKRQMECLIPSCKVSEGLYSVGCGPLHQS